MLVSPNQVKFVFNLFTLRENKNKRIRYFTLTRRKDLLWFLLYIYFSLFSIFHLFTLLITDHTPALIECHKWRYIFGGKHIYSHFSHYLTNQVWKFNFLLWCLIFKRSKSYYFFTFGLGRKNGLRWIQLLFFLC